MADIGQGDSHGLTGKCDMSVMCRCLVSQPGVWVAARWSLLLAAKLGTGSLLWSLGFVEKKTYYPSARTARWSRALAPLPHIHCRKTPPIRFSAAPLPSRLFSPCPFRLSLPQSLSLDSPSQFHPRSTPPQLVDREPPSPSTSRSSTRAALDWVGSHCIASHCTWIGLDSTRPALELGWACTGSLSLHHVGAAPQRTAPHRTAAVTL